MNGDLQPAATLPADGGFRSRLWGSCCSCELAASSLGCRGLGGLGAPVAWPLRVGGPYTKEKSAVRYRAGPTGHPKSTAERRRQVHREPCSPADRAGGLPRSRFSTSHEH